MRVLVCRLCMCVSNVCVCTDLSGLERLLVELLEGVVRRLGLRTHEKARGAQ